ncbi:MAG: hypothetical protein M1840_000071 [Geoglossum simile]|nr:MAG: hypothetical protein M1840_000071 [Geoglossum simile]
MDPLSVAASTIAIVGAAREITRAILKLRALHSAPREFHTLIKEVADFQAVLGDIDTILSSRNGGANLPQGPMLSLSRSLDDAKGKLLELSQIIENRLIKPAPAGEEPKVARQKWLWERTRVKAILVDLKDARISIAVMLGALHLSDISCVRYHLDEVTLITKDLATEHQRFQSETKQQLEQLCEDFSEFRVFSSTQDKTQHMIEEPRQALLTDGRTTESSIAITQKPSQIFGYEGTGGQGSTQISTISAVRIRTSNWRTPCRPGCSCVCHKRHQFQTPRMLEQIIGSLFLGFSGIPINTPPCTERSCHQRAVPSTQISYYFPTWALKRMVSLMVHFMPLDGPVASLRMPRAVSPSSKVFSYASRGDIDGMKYLFQRGLASPHDAAADYDQVEMCKFLLSVKADPYLEDKTQVSAMDVAWSRILSKDVDPAGEMDLRSIFNDTESLERRQFTILHEIVLGLKGGDLDAEIQRAPIAVIDSVDSNGRTALSWAASRGDIKALQILLRNGANPNLASVSDMAPLHFATRPKSPGCIIPLLTSGANVDQRTNWEQTAMHHAASYQDDPQYLKPLLGLGADVNARDLDGIAPLGWAALSSNPRSAAFLINQGAYIDSQDNNGWTALLNSIDCNSHEVLGLLLEHGANWKLTLVTGCTALHRAAERGDLTTMRTLTGAKLEGLDIDAKGRDGLTAREMLQQRLDVTSELTAAFEALLDSIQDGNLGDRQTYIDSTDDDDDDNDDDSMEFADAVEHQQ